MRAGDGGDRQASLLPGEMILEGPVLLATTPFSFREGGKEPGDRAKWIMRGSGAGAPDSHCTHDPRRDGVARWPRNVATGAGVDASGRSSPSSGRLPPSLSRLSSLCPSRG